MDPKGVVMTASGDTFGVRDGEIIVDAPEPADVALRFIGTIHTPWARRDECPKNGAESTAVCTIEVDEPWAQGLAGVETCSHLWVLYWMDKAPRNLVVQAPRHYKERRGTFALRSPARPNPIALSCVELKQMVGNKLTVVGLDCLNGTKLIDIKPYFASTDCKPEAHVGWHADRAQG
jgi:tRNA-Thr(GGU) m(6)t(6)A37 methyltransferase TsaA